MKMAAKFLGILALAATMLATIPAGAQDQKDGSPFDEKGAPPFAKAPGAMGVVQTMSYALGLLRRVGGATRGVNGIFFLASGTMSEPAAGGTWTNYKMPKSTIEMTYYTYHQGVIESPGSRWDCTLVGADGKEQRRIFVSAGKYAWNEETPGGKATPEMAALDLRQKQIWLSPQGLVWAALAADGKSLAEGVTMSQEGGKTVLMIPVNGQPAKVTLGAYSRPEKVETRVKDPVLGDTSIEIDYSDYRDIEDAYGVFFPAHIVEKLGGHTALDITVNDFHTNAYSVFPVPANVRQAGN